MTIRAVLFDIGGPIDTEVEHERLIDQHILEAVRAEGVAASVSALARANREAIASFAPNTYAAIVWSLARRAMAGVSAREEERERLRGGLELRAGIAELISDLHARGLRLGLAANQPARALRSLERLGLAQYFDSREVAGHHGLRKPDVRLFLHACERLEVDPSECVMVGDRIDCDIVPASVLGMRTILYRTGRHIDQQPRSADEVPDVGVTSVTELSAALDGLLW